MKLKISDAHISVINPLDKLDDRVQNLADETNIKIQKAIEAYDAQLQPTEIIVGVHPKKQSKNKLIQWLLIKFFGYELEYKTVMAKTIVIKSEDCSVSGDGNFTFTF